MTAYQGQPGGPSDPATPGGYCLARCYCGTCPQYASQRAAIDLLVEQEVAARDRKRAERDARLERLARVGIKPKRRTDGARQERPRDRDGDPLDTPPPSDTPPPGARQAATTPGTTTTKPRTRTSRGHRR